MDFEEELARAWDILVRQASEGSLERAKISYKKFYSDVRNIPYDEIPFRFDTGQYLYPIQKICDAGDLPPLTGLVVRQANGKLSKPSSGYASNDLLPYEVEMEAVLRKDAWLNVDNPFQNADGTAIDVTEVLLSLQEGGNVLASIRNRGYAQTLFRKGLLEAYDGKCAVCGIEIEEILDAAHIKPWSVCEGTQGGELSNGILLCKNHHRAFDDARWSVSDDYVLLGSSALKQDDVEVDALVTPQNSLLAPNSTYLDYHRKVICKSKFDKEIQESIALDENEVVEFQDIHRLYLDNSFDQQLKRIHHYQMYPQMMPFIGSHYRRMNKRVLIVGESHYLEPGCEVHLNAKNWYAGLSSADFSKVNKGWIFTRQTAGSGINQKYARKAFTIYRNVEYAIKESLNTGISETDNYLRYAAFYNYFQRPAEAKISIANVDLDDRKAYDHFKSLYEVLDFTHLAFVSKRAYHAFLKKREPQEFAEVKIFATAHPACSWWNREHKHWADGMMYKMSSKDWFLHQLDGLGLAFNEQ